MSDLQEMIEFFKNRYVYIYEDGCNAIVRADNELIYKIMVEMTARIEAIEHKE